MPRKSTPVPPPLPTEEEFWRWAATAEVATKDAGLIKITRPWGTQRVLVRTVLEGLRHGIHQFLVTKDGQVGATMAAKLLLAYFGLRHPGMQGVIVANEDDVREACRQDLLSITGSVENAQPARLDNAKVLELENRTRFMMMTAGPKTGGRVGIGRGFALALGTEMALWQNPKALTILRTRFSESHPYRLAIYETTPRGANWWKEVWDEAAGSPGIARIELYWWQREDYALSPTSAAFKHYWDGRLTAVEKRWVKEVARRYGHELTPNQLAWRRQYVSDVAGGDDKTADQEMSTLIEEGFAATGISFLKDEAIRRARRAVASAPTPTRYRYEWGARIEDTVLHRTIPDRATLDVWELPDPVGGYVVAAVPAFSATQKCPDWVVSAWKATRDTLEQVAEYADDDCGMQPFAWVCKHLSASYHAPRRAFILETLGLGMGVLDELRSLEGYGWGTLVRGRLLDLSGASRNFLWRRPDSLTSGASLQMRASTEIRSWVMSRLRDQIVSGAVLIRSQPLLAELERVRQDNDEFIAEGRTPSDHRVWAAALAVYSWSKQLVPLFQRVQGHSTATTVTGRMTEDFFRKLREQRAVGAR